MWHPECRYRYRIASNPHIARCAVFMRDRGVCQGCGVDCTHYTSRWPADQMAALGITEPRVRVQLDVPRLYARCAEIVNNRNYESPRNMPTAPWLGWWHVDHVLALHLVDRAKPDAWEQWWLPNLQTLCQTCHEAKSAAETTARAKADRLAKGPRKSKRQKAIERRQNQLPL